MTEDFQTAYFVREHTATYSGGTFVIEAWLAVGTDDRIYRKSVWRDENGHVDFISDWHPGEPLIGQRVKFTKVKGGGLKRVVVGKIERTVDDFIAEIEAAGFEARA